MVRVRHRGIMILEIRTRTSMHESNKPNRCNGHTNLKDSLGLVYDSNKNKKSQYTLRVITVEKGTFTPLVFFVFGTTDHDHCSSK